MDEEPQTRKRPYATTWTPFSLRWPFLTSLVLALLAAIVGLELVNWKVKNIHGIDLDDQAAANALRYVPTIFTIIVGFAWKGITSDYCMITPWAAISGKWAKAKDSILLNYVDALDIVSIYTAFTHRHWMLAIIITCGFLTGASVALANALAQEIVGSGITRQRELQIAERFVFNGSLAVPLGWRSSLPRLEWQYYNNEDREEGRFPWLTSTHVFPALNTEHYRRNATVVNTVVDTFSASLACTPIAYNTTYAQYGYNSSFVLHASNVENCSNPISQQIIWPYNSSSVLQFPFDNSSGLFDVPPSSWSNVTSCNADDDYRLLATNLVLNINKDLDSPYNKTANLTLYNSTNAWTSDSIQANATGFLCTPHYWSIPASVAIDATSGLISTNFELLTNMTKEIPSVGVGFDFLQAQLNNPYDPSSIKVFQAAATNNQTSQHANSYDWSQFSDLKVMQKYSYLYLLNWATIWNSSYSSRDPFMATIARGDMSTVDLINNSTLFEQRLNLAFAQFMAALVSSTARAPHNTTVDGTVYLTTNYLLIRQDILRLLEAALAVLALVAILFLVFARPKTYLTHHPGSLDQMSLLVANSPEADHIFQGLGQQDYRGLQRHLADVYCRLSHGKQGDLQLEMTRSELATVTLGAPSTSMELRPLGTPPVDSKVNATSSTAEIESTSETHLVINRHRPLALRLGSRAGILFSLGGMISATIVLYLVSIHRDGFEADKSTVPTAFSLVPTIILVLIGYCIASIQQAALTIATYSHLASNTARSGRAMITRQIRDASRLLFDRFTTDWSLIAVPCLVLVLAFPVLKLMAAKLFYASIGAHIVPATFPVDISQIQTINSLSQYIPLATAEGEATSMGDSISLQIGLSTQVYTWFDRIGSLNLPVITYNISSLHDGPSLTSQADEMTARIMAINSSAACTAAQPGDFALYATSCKSTTGYEFTFRCASEDCETRFSLPLAIVNVSRTINPGQDNPTSYPYFGYSYPSAYDDSTDLIFANFSGLDSNQIDFTKISCDDKAIDNAVFGDAIPSVTAVNCTRDLNLVYANVTFTQFTEGTARTSSSTVSTNDKNAQIQEFRTTRFVEIFAGQQQVGWLPYSYEADTIELIRPVISRSTWPASLLIPDGGESLYHVGNELSPNLYPSDFLSLVAQQQDIDTGDAMMLLNASVLEHTAALVYQNWTQTALQYAIGLIYASGYSGLVPESAIPSPELQNVTNSYFTLYRPVVRQDLGFSIALILLLGVALLCVLTISLLIPRSTLLPQAPSNIAAQISMLVDSRVISILRTHSAGGKDFFKDNRFGLGWWRSPAPLNTASGSAMVSNMRWGIDIGVLDAEYRGLRARKRPTMKVGGYEAVSEEGQAPTKPASTQRINRLNTRFNEPGMSTSAYSPLRDRSEEEDMLRFRFDFENRI